MGAANGAEAAAGFGGFEATFEVVAAAPEAGDGEADVAVVGDGAEFGAAGAAAVAAGAVGADALAQVVGVADVVLGGPVVVDAAVEVEEVDSAHGSFCPTAPPSSYPLVAAYPPV